MSERLEKLRDSVQNDEAKVQKLQEDIKSKKEKIKELENAEIMNNLNSLSTQGMAVNDIITAIKNKDLDVLMSLMSSNQSEEKSETSSAFSKINEEEQSHE